MKRLRILAVGRLKTPYWRDAADDYAQRLARFARLEIREVKDAAQSLPLATRKESETRRLLKLLRPATDVGILLDEHGAVVDSRQFALFLRRIADSGRVPCFLVGGAYGLAESAASAVTYSLSLAQMTFPHELARVLLLEQLYRAENILAGTGYHH